jgi:hypothetical protein
MKIIYQNTVVAFIKLDNEEDYPDKIRVSVDRNRWFYKHICIKCSEVFYSRNERNYCSSLCEQNSNRVVLQCKICGNQFTKLRSKLLSKHSVYFCSRKCKDFAQSIDGGCSEIGHYTDGKSCYAERAKKKQGYCDICGETNKDFLVVHHINGDRSCNKNENLRVLCANCHIRGHRMGLWYK